MRIFDVHSNKCGRYLSKGVNDQNDTVSIIYDCSLNERIKKMNDTCLYIELIPVYPPGVMTRMVVMFDSCVVSYSNDKYIPYICSMLK